MKLMLILSLFLSYSISSFANNNDNLDIPERFQNIPKKMSCTALDFQNPYETKKSKVLISVELDNLPLVSINSEDNEDLNFKIGQGNAFGAKFESSECVYDLYTNDSLVNKIVYHCDEYGFSENILRDTSFSSFSFHALSSATGNSLCLKANKRGSAPAKCWALAGCKEE